ncbi:hypothetical protein V1477_007888, partial [Vespula maculifrons]
SKSVNKSLLNVYNKADVKIYLMSLVIYQRRMEIPLCIDTVYGHEKPTRLLSRKNSIPQFGGEMGAIAKQNLEKPSYTICSTRSDS